MLLCLAKKTTLLLRPVFVNAQGGPISQTSLYNLNFSLSLIFSHRNLSWKPSLSTYLIQISRDLFCEMYV